MAKAITPVAKQMLVCDDVVADSSGKVTVVGVWNAVRVPVGASFPYTLGKVCAYVHWRGGLGSVNSHVEIVSATTGVQVVRTSQLVLSFPSRITTVHGRYMIPDVRFPAPGVYLVEVYCEGVFVEDQRIEVL
jgi:hypothetical protein